MPVRNMSLRWTYLVLSAAMIVASAGCSTGPSDVAELSNVERGGASLLARFAVSARDRYPRRVYHDMLREGTLPLTNGYLPPYSPSGPVVMDCGQVDAFGLSFEIDWTGRNRQSAVLNLSHPDIEKRGGSFFGRMYPPVGQNRTRGYTWDIKLGDRSRRNGLYTIEVTQDDEALLEVGYLMVGCEDRSGVTQVPAE